MNKFLFFVITVMLAASCRLPIKKGSKSDAFAKLEMMNTDREFSKMSEEKGMKNAFIEYLDSNGVLLRSNRLPIAGADAIDYLLQQNDTDYILTWEPRDGTVAQSGELGYTYGIYAIRPSKKDTVIYGSYVSIWKKEKDGTWKYVLDSGNEGIGDARNE
jgi:ketosteroid isomerase-like protein